MAGIPEIVWLLAALVGALLLLGLTMWIMYKIGVWVGLNIMDKRRRRPPENDPSGAKG